MPRKARLSIAGCVTHIMARCLDNLALFSDNTDRQQFLGLLEHYLIATECRCYAWALMPNHYHLVVRTGQNDLWRTMKPINTRYAQFHGKKYGRRGPLFMDRYKSIATQDQNYLQELVRYVHLNPVRSGLCKTLRDLDHYPWAGHGALIGNANRFCFQDTAAVLKGFGTDLKRGRAMYRSFLESGLNNDSGDELQALVRASNKGVEKGRDARLWVIGDPAFVSKAVHQTRLRRLRIRNYRTGATNLATIAQEVADAFGIDTESLLVRHRGGPVSLARKAFAWRCVRTFEIPVHEVAAFLHISPGAVSNMLKEGATIIETVRLFQQPHATQSPGESS